MAKQDSVYLNQLKFSPKLAKSFVYKYITNIRLVVLLLLGILPLGIISMLTLPRRLNPEVKLPFVSVSTVLPGASPEEVESLLTIPLEDAIEGVENIKTLESVSQDSVSIISIEFESSVDEESAKQDIQSAVDNVNNLPENATDPRVATFDIENQPIITFAITTENDPASLENIAKGLEDALEDDRNIDRVELSGVSDTQIEVIVNPQLVRSYGINPITLSSQINEFFSAIPSGSITSNSYTYSLSIDKSLNNINDLRNMPITTNTGDVIPLSFVAQVREVNINEDSVSYLKEENEFKRSVVLDVFRNSEVPITDSANIAREIANDYLAEYGEAYKLTTISSSADDISEQFGSLFRSFALTLFLVFITLFIFLGIRQSSIVALSIPITILISFTVMKSTGLSLNFLSVFSLLLALGLLVDDAIVMVSAFTSYYKTKKFTPQQAGILVWNDFIVPIWSTTITTVWAFVPLLLASGIIGEFIKTIPIVVSATLLASTSVAVLITLPITMQAFDVNIPKRVTNTFKIFSLVTLLALYLALVPKDPIGLFILGFVLYILFLLVSWDAHKSKLTNTKIKTPKYIANGIVDSEKISQRYKKLIKKILNSQKQRRLVIAAVVIFSVLSYLLVPLGFVVNEFFPKTDANILYVIADLPSNTLADTTEEVALDVASQIEFEEGIERIAVEVGRGGFDDGFVSTGGSANTARITLTLDDDVISSIDLAEELRSKFETYPGAEITVQELSGGPPVGSDIEIALLGDDLGELDRIATELQNYLNSQDFVTSTNKSIKPTTSKLVLDVDEYELVKRGISLSELGLWMRTYATGFELDEARIGQENKTIQFKLKEDQFELNELSQIEIPTRSGEYIPLLSLGKLIPQVNPTFIARENGQRKITVSAGISESSAINTINQNAIDFLDNELELPEGYTYESGGVNAENQSSVNSILQAMVLSAILILATMVIQLGSYRKAIIVLLVIPFAVSGVFVLFAITRTPLSFPALIGVLALFGIVVNNSIVVVEKINQNLAVGINFKEAIADAAASRVEPIMFSSLTTIMGLIPITITDPLWRGLGGAIIAGLSVSGIIMLLFIPVVYYIWFKADYK